MRLFRNPLFRRLNKKLKGIKLTPCIPSSLDQHLAFEDVTPSSKGAAVLVSTRKRPPPTKNKSPKGEVRFKETTIEVTPPSAFPSLARAISRYADAGPGSRGPSRPPILPSDSSECSIMVLKKDMETGEIGFDPSIERSPLDEAAYRYHYTLRRIPERGDDDLPPRPTTPSPPEDLAAEQYSRLRDTGLISTSFDAFRPLVPGEREVPDAKRHSRLASLFDWADSHEVDSSMDVKDKYAEETERDEQEVFLEAGLWAHTRRISSPCSHGKKSASAPPLADTTASPEVADTAFYIHGNHSADHLPSVDSHSTTAFSPEPFSPRFTLRSGEGEDGVPRSCESLTTENGMQELDDIMSASSKYEYDFALTSTPSPAHRLVSPSAPPNTPWDPTLPDVSMLARAGQECHEGRRSMKSGLDKTYSFISFSSPLRVSLEGTAGAGSANRAAPLRPKANFAVAFSTPRSKASTVDSKRAASAPLLTPVTVSTVVGTESLNSKLDFTKLSPNVPRGAKSKSHEGVLISSFAEDLNKALDVFDSIASGSVEGGERTPGLSVDSGSDKRSECAISPVLGGNMSRFSEELASSDTDEGTSGSNDPISRAPRRRAAGIRGNGSHLPTQRGTRKLQGAQFGFRPSRQYRRILELYTLQYQTY